MRFLIPVLALLSVGLLGELALPAIALAAQQPGGKLDVNIDINKGGGGGDAWWTNPIWIAIGVIALVLLVVIIAMSTRGGGTTVIKE